MKNQTQLPTEDLKKYGIINQDDSFSKKLTKEDFANFLAGYTIIAENDKNRVYFQLKNNNSELDVKVLQFNNSLKDVLEKSKQRIEYTEINEISEEGKIINIEKKAFVFDKENNEIKEYDLIKNSKELTKAIIDKKDEAETNRYKNELLKLREHLIEKIDKFPEIAKHITKDLNIVTNEIHSINAISLSLKQTKEGNKTDIQLNVNDPDLYQDANRMKEEYEQKQEQERNRGLRR